MKTRRVTLNDIFEKALTDKKFLKSLVGKPRATEKVLEDNKLSLSASEMAQLKSLVIHPIPPPWETGFIIASAVLASLNKRIAVLEKKAASPARLGTRVKP